MSKATILIVEDEAIVATDLTRKLKRLGYEVCETAVEGEEAIALASSLRPSLVLMDIRLEGQMDGIAAAEAIRSRIDVPVIYLTALSDSATLARAKLTGPFGYILKPFEERDLATQIELALHKHQADRQVREQREWLQVTLTSIGDAVIAADGEGGIAFLNTVAESLTGWKAEEATGRPVTDVFRVVNEQTGDPLEDPVARVLRDGRTVPLANHAALVTRDGCTVPIEESAAPIRDAAGHIIGIVLVFHDVTEKRHAEEALRKSEERFSLAMEATRDGLWDWSLETDQVYYSPGYASMLGYEPGEFPADVRSWAGHIHPEDRDATLKANRDCIENHCDSFEVEFRMEAKNGEWRWIMGRGKAVGRDRNGRAIRLVGTHTDITGRKRMEEELRKSRDELELRVQERTAELNRTMEALRVERQRFSDVLNVLPAYVALLASDYQVPFANRVFRERFGESRGLRCFEHLFGRTEPCEICETYTVLKTMEPHHWEWTGPDERIYSVFDFPFSDSDGSTLILEMGIDITERKQAEENLASYMAKLEESNRALDDFASIASHDMQEPLRKIISFGDQLRSRCRESLDETGCDYLDRMQKAARRMQILLQALLDYARVSSKAEPFRPIDLDTLVSDVIDDLEVRVTETAGEIQVGTLPGIDADPHQMRQLFQNLIGNALKFHRDGEKPVVRIYCRPAGDGQRVEIVVEDNGIGFDAKYTERIFSPFHRLHGRTSQYEGTGMGLAICKKIVERHGGSITAKSKPGLGSLFILVLPISQRGGGDLTDE